MIIGLWRNIIVQRGRLLVISREVLRDSLIFQKAHLRFPARSCWEDVVACLDQKWMWVGGMSIQARAIFKHDLPNALQLHLNASKTRLNQNDLNTQTTIFAPFRCKDLHVTRFVVQGTSHKHQNVVFSSSRLLAMGPKKYCAAKRPSSAELIQWDICSLLPYSTPLLISLYRMLSGPRVDIYVGEKKKHYRLPKLMLCHYWPFFDKCFNVHFQEGQT